MGQQPISELFLNNIDVLPLWVKQVLYLKTRDKLREELAEFLDILVVDNLIQYYIPKLTFAGKTELAAREKRLPDEFYTFYQGCAEGHDLFEITLANYWTFQQTCSIFVRSIELQFINIPEDDSVISIAQFMAGKIRTGEMMKRLNKIDVMQLEKAIRIQKTRNEEGNPVKMAELMIELGFITEKDVKILLAFKDDAKKRFVMGVGFSLV
ncbi:MAG: hypothetical protein Q4F80_05450, partial [bacterium]|nr:hypothetical protein [bacterium]